MKRINLIILFLQFLIVVSKPIGSPLHFLRASRETTERRISIGIVSKPCSEELPKIGCKEMLEARYIRWLEQAGATVIPIPYTADNATLDILIHSINGLFFTGGGNLMVDADHLTPYSKTLKYLMMKVISENGDGNYFPIWGTCMGFQEMAIIISQDTHILGFCPDKLCDNFSTFVKFVGKGKSAKIFSMLNTLQLDTLGTQNITYNNHNDMLTWEQFYNNQYLPSFFEVLGYSYSSDGKYEFISAMQAKDYPFYGVQWHPEYNNFDFNPHKDIPRGLVADRFSQIFANFLVEESRKNGNRMSKTTLMKYDINNFNTIFDDIRQLCYIFN